MKRTTITSIAAQVAIGVFAAVSAMAGDQEDIQGSWALKSASVDGREMPNVSGTYIFTGETLIRRIKAGMERKATFKLETASIPKVLVVQREDSAHTKPDRTPYALEGDTLKISFPTPDETAPDVSDKGRVLFTLKRTKTGSAP
ncbi:MAG: TIGR03067 domain-containing protein [Chthoniobacterales bacterium]